MKKKKSKLHPQSLIWYHSESNLALASAIIVHNVVHISIQPIVIFNCESEITLWAVHVKNAAIMQKKKPHVLFLNIAHTRLRHVRVVDENTDHFSLTLLNNWWSCNKLLLAL